MEHISKSKETNYKEAVNRASSSNLSANKAFIAMNKLRQIRDDLNEWKFIFQDSPIVISTALFITSGFLEIMFTMPMYYELTGQVTGYKNTPLALVAATFVVIGGALASHYLSKKLSSAMFNYAVFNQTRFSQKTVLNSSAEETVRISTRRDSFKGLILGIGLLIFVTVVSWQRVFLLNLINSADFGLLHKILPIICVLAEIFTGLYLSYIYRRFCEYRKAKKLQKEFVREKTITAYEAKMANDFYLLAKETGEKTYDSKDLHDALYRFQFRAQEDENYCSPVPLRKTLTITVANKTGVLNGIHLAGILSNGEYCNTVYTDEYGEGTLCWYSEAKEVLKVYVDNEEHDGHYMENSKIRINLN